MILLKSMMSWSDQKMPTTTQKRSRQTLHRQRTEVIQSATALCQLLHQQAQSRSQPVKTPENAVVGVLLLMLPLIQQWLPSLLHKQQQLLWLRQWETRQQPQPVTAPPVPVWRLTMKPSEDSDGD